MSMLAVFCCVQMFCLLVVTALRAADPREMALSEIQFLPAKVNDPVWVEFMNCSKKSVDMTGWFMNDEFGHRYNFPERLVVPGGALVVVHFGADVGLSDDTSFSNEVAHLYCVEAWAGAAFRGLTNECALFAPGDEKADSYLRDYVLWGPHFERGATSPKGAYGEAIRSRLWFFESTVYVGGEMIVGCAPPIVPGGSIARVLAERPARSALTGEDWFLCRPDDVTCGAPNNWPAPIPHAASDPSVVLTEGVERMTFSWRGRRGKGEAYRFQLAQDEAFSNALIDVECKGNGYHAELLPGKYFWHVCVTNQNGVEKWSKRMCVEVILAEKRKEKGK